MGKRWYVLQVTAGSERIIKDSILEKAAKSNMLESFGDIFIPSIFVHEVKRGYKVKVEKKIMPGYMFINMEMSDSALSLVTNIPRVAEFLGQKEPTAVSEEEMQTILSEVERQSSNAALPSILDVGTSVEILDGPFESFKGKVSAVDEVKNKVTVVISVFGNDTVITTDASCVKRA
ncbi:transcription termination/antitermination protein NusG [Candidatus Sneabacter namystus]|uniref:Transcription termination/antitermination protein NusG n=1 Tax=Candidatus Sneabacter namystus TaxID=2601646 RepID=A0A5C0UJ07_9RICK|nr:transcription termination/antitermination protein NusG [Candidatus Sneabacter namystus]QEK39740.1 transcription termination/antitermination factor NusG [Candidatus Sneabacter namystus]